VRRSTYTAGWEAGDLGDSRQGECADGDHGCGLHLDRLRHEGCLQKLLGECKILGSREMEFCVWVGDAKVVVGRWEEKK
jgi:hypothetical protein